MSSSRAGSPRSSALLIRHEFIAFVAGMPSAFFGQGLPGKRTGTTGFSERGTNHSQGARANRRSFDCASRDEDRESLRSG
jgi:hypothetical protein